MTVFLNKNRLDKVMLWLGANVMLEYDIDEAQTLLGKNKTNAISSLEEVKMQIGRSRPVEPLSTLSSLSSWPNDHYRSFDGSSLQLGREQTQGREQALKRASRCFGSIDAK